MNFRLVYNNTGDELLFNSVNPKFVEYYIQQLTEHNINKFTDFGCAAAQIDDRLDMLHDAVTEINRFIGLYLGNTLVHNKVDLLDQALLNKYHADWANSHEIMFNIDDMRFLSESEEVIAEFNKVHELFPDSIRDVTLAGLLQARGHLVKYEKLNLDIHHLESAFQKIVYNAIIPPDVNYVKIDNTFGNSIISNDICNLKLSYYVKGRTLYNKFINFDTELEYDDLNNHETQSTRLEMNLSQPQTIPLSKEYITWCKKHNKTPTGDFVNLGNLVNIQENLTVYRQIVYKNLMDKNTCSLVLGE